ncbi:hypothetical protein ACJX0J_030569, partial [Zea mays]
FYIIEYIKGLCVASILVIKIYKTEIFLYDLTFIEHILCENIYLNIKLIKITKIQKHSRFIKINAKEVIFLFLDLLNFKIKTILEKKILEDILKHYKPQNLMNDEHKKIQGKKVRNRESNDLIMDKIDVRFENFIRSQRTVKQQAISQFFITKFTLKLKISGHNIKTFCTQDGQLIKQTCHLLFL